MNLCVKVGGRSSPLSQAQVVEVLEELRSFYPKISFETIWLETTGDKDQITSLKTMDKTNFFTKEIDERQLTGEFRIAIHSAKDLPEPLCQGLKLIALTKGVDPSDVIVLREGESLESLPRGARIGTSSPRREQNVLSLRSDLVCVDIRGNTDKRLELLHQGIVDGVVMAEAAIVRLKYTALNRIPLPGERAALQGRLAVIGLEQDREMQELFACLDAK